MLVVRTILLIFANPVYLLMLYLSNAATNVAHVRPDDHNLTNINVHCDVTPLDALCLRLH